MADRFFQPVDALLIKRAPTFERLAPAELWRKLSERFALIGVQGTVRMAMAGFDVAAWDALAIAAAAAGK